MISRLYLPQYQIREQSDQIQKWNICVLTVLENQVFLDSWQSDTESEW